MTISSLPFLRRSRKEQVGAVIGILASFLAIWLTIIFIYYNPYVSNTPDSGHERIVLIRLGMPAIGILFASLLGSSWLIFAVFIFSLPFYGYMAGTPGIFNLFGLVSLAMVAAAILIRIGKKQRKAERRV